MTAYDRGRRFEWKARDALRDDGYEVLRSAGSKTKIDLVAFKPSQLLFVQCKRDGTCSTDEWDRLYMAALHAGAVPILAVNGPKGRGVAFWRLTGRRVRGAPMGRQPAEPFLTDEVAAAGIRQEWMDAEAAQPPDGPEQSGGTWDTREASCAALEPPPATARGSQGAVP